MASTSIATIFLDRDLLIKRYTPQAVELFHLRLADLGRPIHDLRQTLEYPELIADAEQVLRTLVPVERQVRDEHHFYQTRIQPYRTLEDHIAGVVLTCVDVTEEKGAADARAADLAATTRLSHVAEHLIQEGDITGLLDAILDTAIAITHADAGTIHLLDEEPHTLRMLPQRGFPAHVVEHFSAVDATSGSPCARALEERRRVVLDFDVDEGASDSDRWHREEAGFSTGQSTPLIARNGRVLGMLSTHWKSYHRPGEREMRFFDLLARQAADAIERKQSDDLLREQMEELQRFNAAAVGRETRMIELKKEINDLLVRMGAPPRYSPPVDEETGNPPT